MHGSAKWLILSAGTSSYPKKSTYRCGVISARVACGRATFPSSSKRPCAGGYLTRRCKKSSPEARASRQKRSKRGLIRRWQNHARIAVDAFDIEIARLHACCLGHQRPDIRADHSDGCCRSRLQSLEGGRLRPRELRASNSGDASSHATPCHAGSDKARRSGSARQSCPTSCNHDRLSAGRGCVTRSMGQLPLGDSARRSCGLPGYR